MGTTFNEQVGNKIRTARKEKGITMKELGEKVGLTESNIQRYESGKIKGVDVNLLIKICDVLDLSVPYVMGWEVPEISQNEKKLLSNYNKLNDFGQSEAIKRVSELTEIEKYTYTTTKIETIAAHADHIDSEQINLINEDIEDMKNW